MTTSTTDELYYDPWHADLNVDPYPMFKRLRDEAPLYYNDEHDFFALSRFDDANRTLVDHQSFSSARGAVLEIIKSGMEIPPGLLIFEDPPIHDIHRNLLARAFTPRKINALEPMIREFTQKCLDPVIGGDRFDFVKDLGAVMPLRVVSMLFGIPEDYQHRVQEDGDRHVRTERGGADDRQPRWSAVRRSGVRGVHRLARGASRRRSHYRTSQRRIHRREPAPRESCAATNYSYS